MKKRLSRKPNLTVELEGVFFGEVDPRRRQEYKDSRMVQEDHDEVANLSPKFIHREFNQQKYVEHFKDNIFEISGD